MEEINFMAKKKWNQKELKEFKKIITDKRQNVLENIEEARGRADDKPEVIKHRIQLYKKETGPVIEHYRDHDGFVEIKAEGAEPEEIAKEIINKVKE